jgi:hypothetical protein
MQRRRTIPAAAIAMALAVAGITLATGTNDQASAGGNTGHAGTQAAGACDFPANGRRTEIATAKLIVEYNATDRDIGVHGAFDDHGWKRLCVFDPNDRPVLHVGPRGQLLDLTMAGIFFESREPPASEFSFADLRAAFPEGRYRVRGRSFDGTILVGSATFTHDVPAAPVITAPELAEEPEATRKNPVPLEGLVIDWDQVTETVDGGPVDITGYEVIVTKENHNDPHGFSRPIYDVHVPAAVDRLPVPKAFLQRNTVYELEVLALEASGNQTISVGFFRTASVALSAHTSAR